MNRTPISANPVSADEVLSAILDLGLRDGLGSLTRKERELFFIKDFIIETEFGGLSGYLYNRVGHRGRLAATAGAMERYDLSLLAPIARELHRRFSGWGRRSARGDTWEEILERCIPSARLSLLESRLDRARERGFGLEESKLAALVTQERWAAPARAFMAKPLGQMAAVRKRKR